VASLGSAEELWRRALDLNLRYYGALGRLTADYVKDFFTVLGDVRPPQTGPRPQPVGEPARPAPPAPEKRPAVMVLEEDAGRGALGVFLVENHLQHDVSARPVASVFVDPAGRQVQPSVKFDPEVVALRSGEQSLVRVLAVIDETLEPEVRYEGEVTIPELAGTRIPIVLRRRAVVEKSPDEPPPPSVPASAPSRPRRKPSKPLKPRKSSSAQRRH
jgi:hypothetical protein